MSHREQMSSLRAPQKDFSAPFYTEALQRPKLLSNSKTTQTHNSHGTLTETNGNRDGGSKSTSS